LKRILLQSFSHFAMTVSRTARVSQPPGGTSSISLGWEDYRHSNVQRQSSARTGQPTPRRTHEAYAPSSVLDSCYEGDGRRSARATPMRQSQSHGRDDNRKMPQQASSRYGRHGSAQRDAQLLRGAKTARDPYYTNRDDLITAPLSARTPEPKSRTHRRLDSNMRSTSRSTPQFCPPSRSNGERRQPSRQEPHTARSRPAESDWDVPPSRTRNSFEHPSRTLPGEELCSPIYNPWVDERNDEPLYSQQSGPLSARRRANERTESRCNTGRDYSQSLRQRSAAIQKSQEAKQNCRSAPDTCNYKDATKQNKKLVYGRSMGSSVATSAQGPSSVIDSIPSDLWETSSVDSLPLGAEWFNFMHGRK
jgi:hypothetical protein